ncbi:hypothetical protein EDB84DRAFT_59037 [Lactarius hengduanensis]|nr:hypothetical protein EDB84DRAFT_59037 [Lactarius hengduanensis]
MDILSYRGNIRAKRTLRAVPSMYFGRDITQVDESVSIRRLFRAGKYESCSLGKCSSPSVSVGCAASPSVSENTGVSPREYLFRRLSSSRCRCPLSLAQGSCPGCASYETLIDMPMDRALVSGVFSNSPSLCVFGAITTIGLGEGTKLENGNLESDHFRWTMLVSASAWLTVSATRVPGPQSGVLCILSLCPCVSHAGIFYPLQGNASCYRG